ncbi:MAG: glycosyltransferase family 2 protein [Oscillospiraceae bacterium]|nr:glycosyltransferase family 2 protein [Oscillospiraceae bacterium]
MLSVIIPAYNEQENISNTSQVISGILDEAAIEFEIVFVDDGSKDNTWTEICSVAKVDHRVRGVRFSRNFGKEGAIFAGLRAVTGDCTVLIDCDLQHPPELIPKMYRMWESGAEVVEAVKASRGREGLLYKLFAKSFYKIMKSSSGIDLDGASDFRLLDRKAIDALNEMPERLTFFRALSSWVGFSTEKIEFDVKPRAAGKTKWNFRKLFRFALNSITSFTDIPLHLITGVGVVFGIFAVILGIQTLINYFCGNAQEGFSTVILLILIVGACVLIGIGVIGFYMSKIYEEIKQRPRYIVAERVGLENRKGGCDK